MPRWLAVLAVLLMPVAAQAQEEINQLTGTIEGFECGDNCYLIVTFGDAGWLSALCVAPACDPWNEEAVIPEELIGSDVSVVVGAADQYQGDGSFMPYVAFTTVTVLP